MTKYNDIFEEAIDNHGLISSRRAAELGISNNELVQYACRGRIERVGQGLYRLVQRMTEENDQYALAVELVGAEAYLAGESVIAMLRLAPTNPKHVYIATPKRVRKKLPDEMVILRANTNDEVAIYDGIPSQKAVAAIRSCIGKMMPERLKQAADKALQDGYITSPEYNELVEDLG